MLVNKIITLEASHKRHFLCISRNVFMQISTLHYYLHVNKTHVGELRYFPCNLWYFQGAPDFVKKRRRNLKIRCFWLKIEWWKTGCLQKIDNGIKLNHRKRQKKLTKTMFVHLSICSSRKQALEVKCHVFENTCRVGIENMIRLDTVT